MCIAILSTAHPDYPLILLDNRDEWLDRPTAVADFWPPPCEHVLGGRDLQRSVHGTWLGITKQGRIAVLTNYHDENAHRAVAPVSRGAVVNAWLKGEGGEHETAEMFASRLLEGGQLEGAGGFILMFGQLQDAIASGSKVNSSHERGHEAPTGLAVLSNRLDPGSSLPYIVRDPGTTTAVSNAPFGDRSWPKVIEAERLVQAVVEQALAEGDTKARLIERLMNVLDRDTMPEWDGEEDWKKYTRRMEDSIFVRKFPLLGFNSASTHLQSVMESPGRNSIAAPSQPETTTAHEAKNGAVKGARGYGTTKQTIMLLEKTGDVTYLERTLWDEREMSLDTEGRDRMFEFRIEGW